MWLPPTPGGREAAQGGPHAFLGTVNMALMGSVTAINHGQRLVGRTLPPAQALWLQLYTQTAAVSPQRGFLPDGSWSMRSRHPGCPGPQRAQREPERLVPAEAELGGCRERSAGPQRHS